MVLVAGFSTTAAAGQGATQAAARPMTVDDALRLVRLGDVLISPDGVEIGTDAMLAQPALDRVA